MENANDIAEVAGLAALFRVLLSGCMNKMKNAALRKGNTKTSEFEN